MTARKQSAELAGRGGGGGGRGGGRGRGGAPWDRGAADGVSGTGVIHVSKKEIREMSLAEQERYANAVDKMMESEDGVPGSSQFFRLASYHGGCTTTSVAPVVCPRSISHVYGRQVDRRPRCGTRRASTAFTASRPSRAGTAPTCSSSSAACAAPTLRSAAMEGSASRTVSHGHALDRPSGCYCWPGLGTMLAACVARLPRAALPPAG